MKKIKDSKEIYDHIIIPGELKQLVDNTLNKHIGKLSYTRNESKNKIVYHIFKYTITAAASLIICFTIALNTSEVFAKEIDKIPIINSLAKVLTVRSYDKVNDNESISVKVPGIEINQTDNSNLNGVDKEKQDQFVAGVNKEIQKIVDGYIADAQKRIEEYKMAFIQTGGTEEEWQQKNIDIKVDYDVKYQADNRLSLVLTADENWCSAYGKRYYYNLDLKDDTNISLKDILGEDFINVVNKSIISQMKKRVQENTDYVYWGIAGNGSEDIDGFSSVDEDTNFYLNEKGNPVICFNKYDIAPGFMGVQEFEISK